MSDDNDPSKDAPNHLTGTQKLNLDDIAGLRAQPPATPFNPNKPTAPPPPVAPLPEEPPDLRATMAITSGATSATPFDGAPSVSPWAPEVPVRPSTSWATQPRYQGPSVEPPPVAPPPAPHPLSTGAPAAAPEEAPPEPSPEPEEPAAEEVVPERPETYNTPPRRLAARTVASLMTTEDAGIGRWMRRHVGRGSRLDKADVERLRDLLEAMAHVLEHGDEDAPARIRKAWETLWNDAKKPTR